MFTRSTHLGYTLIEVLAVVLLLGLISVSFLPSVVQISEQSRTRKTVSDLLQLDARARLLSARGQTHQIRYTADRLVLESTNIGDDPVEVSSVQIPEKFDITLSDESGVIQLDAFGVSPHYSLTLKSDEVQVEITYNGISGWYSMDGIDE